MTDPNPQGRWIVWLLWEEELTEGKPGYETSRLIARADRMGPFPNRQEAEACAGNLRRHCDDAGNDYHISIDGPALPHTPSTIPVGARERGLKGINNARNNLQPIQTNQGE